jgi:hypothetical protein
MRYKPFGLKKNGKKRSYTPKGFHLINPGFSILGEKKPQKICYPERVV